MRWLTFFCWLTLGAAHVSGAELTDVQREQILTEAQEAYDRGLSLVRNDLDEARRAFGAAAERFGQLADDGVRNAGLQYNLGNAWFQAGDLGRAILHYRQAQRLSPEDPRIRHNLEYARSQTRSRIAPSGGRALGAALLGWHQRIPLALRVDAFLGAWVMFWVLLALNQARGRTAFRVAAVVATAIWIACGASAAVQLADTTREGVVIADDVVVRKGNSEAFEPQFEQPLHQGVEFDLIEQRPGWLRIRLPNDKTGWIPSDAAAILSEG